MSQLWDKNKIELLLRQNPTASVTVFANWCNHCQTLVQKLQTKYRLQPNGQTSFPKEGVVLLEEANITKGTVQAFPTVFSLQGGKVVQTNDVAPVLRRFGM